MLNLTQDTTASASLSSSAVMLVLVLVLLTGAATDFGLYKLRGRGMYYVQLYSTVQVYRYVLLPSLILITGDIIRQIIATMTRLDFRLDMDTVIFLREIFLNNFLVF